MEPVLHQKSVTICQAVVQDFVQLYNDESDAVTNHLTQNSTRRQECR